MTEKETGKCGIVMPISEIDGCSEGHWQDVLAILQDSIKDSGYEPNLVSEATDVGIIQKRIVQNLYDNEIVVCDISGRNPNVMFELGMRLAFDKPIIVIKDDKTPYSFDTSPVEHLLYPRDLRFNKISEFKSKLSAKIRSVAESDQEHSFLKSFGSFKVAELSVESASVDSIILDELEVIKREMRSIRRSRLPLKYDTGRYSGDVRILREKGDHTVYCVRGRLDEPEDLEVLRQVSKEVEFSVEKLGHSHFHVSADFSNGGSKAKTISSLKAIVRQNRTSNDDVDVEDLF